MVYPYVTVYGDVVARLTGIKMLTKLATETKIFILTEIIQVLKANNEI